MQNSKPRDFHRYPMSEADLIVFDIPESEKELKHKLATLREQVNQRLENISSNQIYNEIILDYLMGARREVQIILFEGEVHWSIKVQDSHSIKVVPKKDSMARWLGIMYDKTLEVIKRELLELLDEPNGKD